MNSKVGVSVPYFSTSECLEEVVSRSGLGKATVGRKALLGRGEGLPKSKKLLSVLSLSLSLALSLYIVIYPPIEKELIFF